MIKIKIKKRLEEIKVVTPERYAELLAMSKKLGQSEDEFKKRFTTQEPEEKTSSINPADAVGEIKINDVVDWQSLPEEQKIYIKKYLTFGKESGFNVFLEQGIPFNIVIANKNNVPIGWAGFFDEITERGNSFGTLMAYITEAERRTNLASSIVKKLLEQKPYEKVLSVPKDKKIAKFFKSLIPLLKSNGVKSYRILTTADPLQYEVSLEDNFWKKNYLDPMYNSSEAEGYDL